MRGGAGRTVVGICGGHQMLARCITDQVESGAGTLAGPGLLPTDVVFEVDKQLALTDGSWDGHQVHGYEIHHVVATVDGGGPSLDGCRVGSGWGTTRHGTSGNDGFRRAFLARPAATAGVEFKTGSRLRGIAVSPTVGCR